MDAKGLRIPKYSFPKEMDSPHNNWSPHKLKIRGKKNGEMLEVLLELLQILL